MKRVAMDTAHIADFSALEDAVRNAHAIRVESYQLGHNVETELCAAEARGADVRVVLSGHCFGVNPGMLETANNNAVRRMRAAGVAAEVSCAPVHRKELIADGDMFLDTRNFSGAQDVIARTSAPRETADARRAFDALWKRANVARRRDEAAAAATASSRAPTCKGSALAQELHMLADPHVSSIDLATESLGPCALTHFLESAATGHAVRVIANARTFASSAPMRAEIAALSAAGVAVRLSSATDKFAVTTRDAWVGSANASSGAESMSEWGTVFSDGPDRQWLARRFEKCWSTARPPAPS